MKKFICSVALIASFAIAQEASAQTTTHSRARKTTAIGAVAGAATGAAVSKNHRGKGAVIGGVVGAAGGYTYGKHRDKKRGRKVVVKH
jgi:uncharacterized membrane protein